MRSFLTFGALAVFAACGPATPGSVALGDGCEYDRDCTPPTADQLPLDAGPGFIEFDYRAVCQCRVCTLVGFSRLDQRCGAVTCTPDESCWFGALGGFCVANVGEGESCAMADCRAGLYCDAGTCAKQHAPGDTCKYDNQSSCLTPAYCAKSGRCMLPGGEGATCDSDLYEQHTCQVGLNCTLANVCVVPQLNGAACADDFECLGGTCSLAGRCESTRCGH
jgi:hypothetical protein